ncbi:DUF1992 domain-containing protein [Naumannella halotolerans]|uniref:Uncharacterized protein DUF1992 n=1 Tax=Naumannella halotolerans TaxID=993414 RepID=A0A4R7JBX3_9ACTN|nr:DUF1992 domain-containing protein [Naumannella halotolerans]TDT34506.1 uncharacterized protein DUF1992 [Naumannella halotolerans]
MGSESWVDQQIREAMERGEFDNLPGSGKPIENLRKDDPDWWIKQMLRREGIDPPPSERELLREEVENLDQNLRLLDRESEVRHVLSDLNRRIRSARMRPRAVPNRIVQPVDIEAAISRWKERS